MAMLTIRGTWLGTSNFLLSGRMQDDPVGQGVCRLSRNAALPCKFTQMDLSHRILERSDSNVGNVILHSCRIHLDFCKTLPLKMG